MPLPGPDVHSVGAWLAAHDPLPVARRLTDPLIEAHGHEPSSLYVESFWLPVLGPTATWLLRRLDASVGSHLPVEVLAASLGVGHKGGANSPFVKALHRLLVFDVVSLGGAALYVPSHLPPLSARHRRRLPEVLVAAEATFGRAS